MFVSQLSPPQQEAFLQLATMLVAVDGDISSEEQEMLSEIAITTMDWVPREDIPIAVMIQVFDSTHSRSAALMELIGLAHADTVYGPEEQTFIADIASRMGISTIRLAQMESWVVRQLSLVREGFALLEDG
jgi:tellurite resistance protein